MELIRFFFSKQEEASYISHLDLQRVMARCLRRSGIPVWYSQGFNPHIYMSFSLPLPLLQHSVAETMDCKTEAENEDFSRYIRPLNEALPKGIAVSRIARPVHKAEAIALAEYQITYPGRESELAAALRQYNSAPEAPVLRKTKRSEQTVDLKQDVPLLTVLQEAPEAFTVLLPAGNQRNYNPELLTRFLEQAAGLPAEDAQVLRRSVYTARHELFC